MEEARTDPRLEVDHRGRHGRAWQLERISGAGEACAFDDTGKGAEELDTIQGLGSI
jgi:hypothetical protein